MIFGERLWKEVDAYHQIVFGSESVTHHMGLWHSQAKFTSQLSAPRGGAVSVCDNGKKEDQSNHINKQSKICLLASSNENR